MNGIDTKVIDILVNRFDLDREAITAETTFHELEMDSLFIVEFLVVAEREFTTKISDDLVSPEDTISTAAAKIQDVIIASNGPA